MVEGSNINLYEPMKNHTTKANHYGGKAEVHINSSYARDVDIRV